MAQWLSSGELDERIKSMPNPDGLVDLYGLSVFALTAFLPKNVQLAREWTDHVVLTEEGKRCLKQVRDAGLPIDDVTAPFVFFQAFYHKDLLVDHNTSNVDAILALLNRMHRDKSARWAYVFGKQLYSKFNAELMSNKTDDLDPGEALQLLDHTPQGVFQIGTLLSGPLGLIRSTERRLLPPTRRILLWHCSDPGCQAGHPVKLRPFRSPLQQVIRSLSDSFGPASEWDTAIEHIWRTWVYSRPFLDLPAIIGDCIVGKERTSLLLSFFRSSHNSVLTKCLTDAGRSIGDPILMTAGLSPEEQHQLLLVVPDRDIVRHIDLLIASKEIKIPPAEVRQTKTYVYKPSMPYKGSCLSSLGISCTRHAPVIELAAAIWSTFESMSMTDDLGWRLRRHEGTTPHHSVVDFIRVYGPEQAVRDLILPSKAVTSAVAERLLLQIVPGEEEGETVRRMLWKLGFAVPRYEESYQLLRNRLQEFHTCVLELGPDLNEKDRARVRSVGVNLFVSVESFLEDLICYNVWLLCSDHFIGTHFRFMRCEAHTAVVKNLGKSIQSGETEWAWSVEGANTLGTLLVYLEAYRQWVTEWKTADRKPYVRGEQDVPHYAKDAVLVFPFKHTQLWADVEPGVMATYSDLLEKIYIQLAQADLPGIRNGIDHKRDEEGFPTADRMIGCALRLQQVIDVADSKRLVPKLFWGRKSESDSCGNVCDTFADYRGTLVSLWNPPPMVPGVQKKFGIPYIIAPFDFLGEPNSVMVFNVGASSEYADYWMGYPKRRFIPPNPKTTVASRIDSDGAAEQPDACDSRPTAPVEEA